ncbi:MAG: hypothetical protein OEW60_02215 [Thiovulaceae bacterium]|nr:hypothetical protein [Sulfurimonadaceae bacterium]
MAELDIDEETGKRVKQPTDAEILKEVEAKEEMRLKTHELIDKAYVGNIETLSRGHCRVSLVTAEWMTVDSEHMVMSSFINMSAEFTALAAINEPNGMIMTVDAAYLAPIRMEEEIIFDATVRHTDGRKREVDVVGKFNDIKVYESRITITITEYHPLKIKLNDVAGVI